MIVERFARFPPGLGQIRVPTSSADAAAAGLSLYTACRPRTLWLQKAAWRLTRVFGTRVLPGRRAPWHPPLAHDAWKHMLDQWSARFGAFDTLAVHERSSGRRPAFLVLLLDGGVSRAFVKVRNAEEQLQNEFEATSRVCAYQPESFFVPRPLSFGESGGWAYLALEPLPPGIHRAPRRPPLKEILAEIEAAIGDRSKPAGVPAHWRPMHGDFAPWNLREVSDGRLALFDWDGTAWGPPGADEVFYRAVESVLNGTSVESHPAEEAVVYWADRVKQRSAAAGRDRVLDAALVHTLERMAPTRASA
jgi:hypothetical protein